MKTKFQRPKSLEPTRVGVFSSADAGDTSRSGVAELGSRPPSRMKQVILIIAFFDLALHAIAQDKVSVTGATVTEVGIYTARVIKKFAVPGVTGGTNEGLDSFSLVQATTNV